MHDPHAIPAWLTRARPRLRVCDYIRVCVHGVDVDVGVGVIVFKSQLEVVPVFILVFMFAFNNSVAEARNAPRPCPCPSYGLESQPLRVRGRPSSQRANNEPPERIDQRAAGCPT